MHRKLDAWLQALYDREPVMKGFTQRQLDSALSDVELKLLLLKPAPKTFKRMTREPDRPMVIAIDPPPPGAAPCATPSNARWPRPARRRIVEVRAARGHPET
jgi:hypothetical protein